MRTVGRSSSWFGPGRASSRPLSQRAGWTGSRKASSSSATSTARSAGCWRSWIWRGPPRTTSTPTPVRAPPGTSRAAARHQGPARRSRCAGSWSTGTTTRGPRPTLNAVPILTLQKQLSTPNLSWDFVALSEPERWDEYFAAGDLPRADGADFTVGGRRYGLFAHDFRKVPVDAWIERWTERALAQDVDVAPREHPKAFLVLSHPDFEAAVRQGFKDLRRPDLLARNPLLRTRLVADRTGGAASGAAVLEAVLREAATTLARPPSRRQAAAGGRPDLPAPGRHPGGGSRRPRAAVQHLPTPPHPRHDPHRLDAVGPGGVRTGPSRSEHFLTW